MSSVSDNDTSTSISSVEESRILSAYIALGSLHSDLLRSTPTEIYWSEILVPSHLIDLLNDNLQFIHPLVTAKWIRLFSAAPFGRTVLRVYLLADDISHSTIDRNNRTLRKDLINLCSYLDTSLEAWNGRPNDGNIVSFDTWASRVDHSLFWLFNTLPSPSPCAGNVKDRYSKLAMEEILSEHSSIPGLKAKLFPYQARTVATMIRKEAKPDRMLDPRYEKRMSPDGRCYYYNARDSQFRLALPQYECNRGGILAETMGVG